MTKSTDKKLVVRSCLCVIELFMFPDLPSLRGTIDGESVSVQKPSSVIYDLERLNRLFNGSVNGRRGWGGGGVRSLSKCSWFIKSKSLLI